MKYYEISIEKAKELCNKSESILVAEQDFNNKDCNIVFVQKEKEHYRDVFKDIKTVILTHDGFVSQLIMFTEFQYLEKVQHKGVQKIVLVGNY